MVGFIKRLIKRLLRWNYNQRNSTKIKSNEASLKANYGYGVLIGESTIISNNVKIGDYSYINRGSYIENCSIGKYCSISSGVYICPFEHDYKMKSTHPIIRQGKGEIRLPVFIGNDVLISLNAVILEGVIIGDGAVIGAGAVVTKDVEPYEIVGGVPAKHIKYRFSKEEILKLQSLRWWEWSIEKIILNKDYLNNVVDTIR